MFALQSEHRCGGDFTLMLVDQHQSRCEEPKESEVHPAFLRVQVRILPEAPQSAPLIPPRLTDQTPELRKGSQSTLTEEEMKKVLRVKTVHWIQSGDCRVAALKRLRPAVFCRRRETQSGCSCTELHQSRWRE